MDEISAPAGTRPLVTASAATLRPRRARVVLVQLFAAVLLIFPSAVALAGPLRSNGAPARLVGLGMMTLLILRMLRPDRDRTPVRVQPVVVVLLLFLVSELFFFGWRSLSTEDPAGVLRELLFSVAACGVALFAALRVRTVASVHRVVAVLLAGCVLSVLVGLGQVASIPARWVDLVTLPGFTQVTTTTGNQARLGLVRVLGTASHPIEYSVVLGACLPLALHLVLHAGSHGARRCAMVATGLIALGLPLALSRGGLLCIALSMLIFLAVQRWTVRLGALLMGVAAAALAFLFAPSLASALVRLFVDSGQDQSIAGRTSDYPIVAAAFEASPWLGGALPPTLLDNEWLNLLGERGMAGVAAFLLLVALPLAGLLATTWRLRGGDPVRRSLAAALAGAVAAIAVSGAFFDLLSFGQAALLLFLLIGLSSPVVTTVAEAAGLRSAGSNQSTRSTMARSPEPDMTLPSPTSIERGSSSGP